MFFNAIDNNKKETQQSNENGVAVFSFEVFPPFKYKLHFVYIVHNKA